MNSRIRNMASKVRSSLGRFVSWMGRGYIPTKTRSVFSGMRETFANSTHNGSVSSGLARTAGPEKFVYMSDIDGSDMLEDFKMYVGKLKEENPDSCFPVKVFMNSGVFGMYAHTEMLIVMVYGGIPYILPIHRSLDGIDEADAEFVSRNNSVITRLFNQNSSHVVSLGQVGDDVNLNEYVLARAKSSPMFESTDIDISLVGMAIADGTINTVGSLYLPGGYLYDIYVIDGVTARAIRPYRDFTVDRVDGTDHLAYGREVILVGGEPDVVCVGSQVAPDGYVYDVWVPNDARYYSRARAAVTSGILPLLGVSVEDDEYEESYAMLLKMLLELDEEANGPADDDTSPDILVNPDDDSDTDEVPVLIELPEYLS